LIVEKGSIQKLENLLLIAVPRDLLDDEVLQLRREVLQAIRQYQSRWVLLDFSLVDICDSFFGRFIQSMAHMAGLMGAQVIVSGLHDAVVETLVGLGMTLPNIQAVLDLDDALALSRTGQLSHNGQMAELPSGLVGEEFEQATWLGQHTAGSEPAEPGPTPGTPFAAATRV
jgi:anti-anti-sigma regulatory factor